MYTVKLRTENGSHINAGSRIEPDDHAFTLFSAGAAQRRWVGGSRGITRLVSPGTDI